MTLKDVMDPIQWYEYVSDMEERGFNIDENGEVIKETPKEKIKPREPDYKKMLDPIQYYEYMSEKDG